MIEAMFRGCGEIHTRSDIYTFNIFLNNTFYSINVLNYEQYQNEPVYF